MKKLIVLLLASLFVSLTSCGNPGSGPGQIDLDAIGKQLQLLHKNTEQIIAETEGRNWSVPEPSKKTDP